MGGSTRLTNQIIFYRVLARLLPYESRQIRLYRASPHRATFDKIYYKRFTKYILVRKPLGGVICYTYLFIFIALVLRGNILIIYPSYLANVLLR